MNTCPLPVVFTLLMWMNKSGVSIWIVARWSLLKVQYQLINKIGENCDCSPKNWVFKRVSKQTPFGRLIRWQSVCVSGEGERELRPHSNHQNQSFCTMLFWKNILFPGFSLTSANIEDFPLNPWAFTKFPDFSQTLKNFEIPLIFPWEPWMFLAPPPPPQIIFNN